MIGKGHTCEETIAFLREIQELYFSSFNPFHPFFNEMPTGTEAIMEWRKSRFVLEPTARVDDWISNMSNEILGELGSCLAAVPNDLFDEIDLAIGLMLSRLAIADVKGFCDIFIPTITSSEGTVSEVEGCAIETILEIADNIQMVPLLKRRLSHCPFGRSECIERVLKIIGTDQMNA